MQACPSLAAPPDEPTLEKLIVIALILYCSAVFCKVRFSTRHSLSTSVAATRELPKLAIPEAKEGRKALIWVFMVVIDSWRSRDGRLRLPGLDLLRLFKARFPDMENWKDVVCVVQKFFWTEDMGRFVSQSWENA